MTAAGPRQTRAAGTRRAVSHPGVRCSCRAHRTPRAARPSPGSSHSLPAPRPLQGGPLRPGPTFAAIDSPQAGAIGGSGAGHCPAFLGLGDLLPRRTVGSARRERGAGERRLRAESAAADTQVPPFFPPFFLPSPPRLQRMKTNSGDGDGDGDGSGAAQPTALRAAAAPARPPPPAAHPRRR